MLFKHNMHSMIKNINGNACVLQMLLDIIYYALISRSKVDLLEKE